MSKSRVAALVCEGQTDIPILRAIIMDTWPEIDEVRCLQPEVDEMDRARTPAGWTQVKQWCEKHAGALDEVLSPDLGDPIDLLLVVLDVDIAVEAGIANPPHSVGVYETNRLRQTVAGWLTTDARPRLPDAVVISTPVRAVETWIIAALFPKESSAETIQDPAAFLVNRKRLRRSQRDGKPWKELHLYRGFASTIAKKTKQIRRKCVEANRTMVAIEQQRRAREKL
jgi:hypothetical protein